MKLGGELGGASVKRKYFSKTIRFRTLVYSYMPKNRLLNEAAIGVIVCFCVNSTVDTFVCACACVCVCACVHTCLCVCIYSSTVKTSSVCKISVKYLRARINDLVLGIFYQVFLPSSFISLSKKVIFHQRRKLQQERTGEKTI